MPVASKCLDNTGVIAVQKMHPVQDLEGVCAVLILDLAVLCMSSDVDVPLEFLERGGEPSLWQCTLQGGVRDEGTVTGGR